MVNVMQTSIQKHRVKKTLNVQNSKCDLTRGSDAYFYEVSTFILVTKQSTIMRIGFVGEWWGGGRGGVEGEG